MEGMVVDTGRTALVVVAQIVLAVLTSVLEILLLVLKNLRTADWIEVMARSRDRFQSAAVARAGSIYNRRLRYALEGGEKDATMLQERRRV